MDLSLHGEFTLYNKVKAYTGKKTGCIRQHRWGSMYLTWSFTLKSKLRSHLYLFFWLKLEFKKQNKRPCSNEAPIKTPTEAAGSTGLDVCFVSWAMMKPAEMCFRWTPALPSPFWCASVHPQGGEFNSELHDVSQVKGGRASRTSASTCKIDMWRWCVCVRVCMCVGGSVE